MRFIFPLSLNIVTNRTNRLSFQFMIWSILVGNQYSLKIISKSQICTCWLIYWLSNLSVLSKYNRKSFQGKSSKDYLSSSGKSPTPGAKQVINWFKSFRGLWKNACFLIFRSPLKLINPMNLARRPVREAQQMTSQRMAF